MQIGHEENPHQLSPRRRNAVSVSAAHPSPSPVHCQPVTFLENSADHSLTMNAYCIPVPCTTPAGGRDHPSYGWELFSAPTFGAPCLACY